MFKFLLGLLRQDSIEILTLCRLQIFISYKIISQTEKSYPRVLFELQWILGQIPVVNLLRSFVQVSVLYAEFSCIYGALPSTSGEPFWETLSSPRWYRKQRAIPQRWEVTALAVLIPEMLFQACLFCFFPRSFFFFPLW